MGTTALGVTLMAVHKLTVLMKESWEREGHLSNYQDVLGKVIDEQLVCTVNDHRGTCRGCQ